jgi:hypothetical protein
LKSNNVQTQYSSYISSKSNGSFVITHNTAAGTETVNYIIITGASDNIKIGNGTLSSGTSKTITDANVDSNSKIFVQATSASTFGKFPRVISKTSGSFDIGYASASTSELFDYVVINGSPTSIYTGSGTLSSGTSTTVSNANAASTSTILLQSTNSMSAYAYWRITSKGTGSFDIGTNSVAGTETFDYGIFNF